MPRLVTFSLLVHFAGCAVAPAPDSVTSRHMLAIKDVNVVPMDREGVQRNRTVLIADERIVAIQRPQDEIPSGAHVINGHGRYLLPGLWDIHVHTLDDADVFFPLFLAHGVTGVRDMGGHLESLRSVRERQEGGDLAGPRVIAAGPLLDGPRQPWSHAIAWHLETAGQAQSAVDSLARIGVDFVKVYSTLSRDAYLGLASAAREQGLPFAGHVPFAVSADEASRVGQVSLEHAGLGITTVPCVVAGADRMRALLGVWTSQGYEAFLQGTAQLRAERDSACVEQLFTSFRVNGTWVTPTIVNAVKDSASVNWPAVALLPDERRDSCRATVALFDEAPDPVRARHHGDFLEDVGRLHRAGVGLLAGTDVPNPCIVPGASLHDELEWLVKAGLSPYEALQAATVNPAILLGAADSFGGIRIGATADLVLVAENPLDDIRAIRSVTAVVVGGRYMRTDNLLAR